MYPSNCGTPTVNFLTFKLHLRSAVFTLGEKFVTVNIRDVYLNKPMDRFEYTTPKLGYLPEDFVKKYNVEPKADKHGPVYVEVGKILFGLPQEGLMAHKILKERLNIKGHS